jgi:hypothetical protein
MPSNPYKDERVARIAIDNAIEQIVKLDKTVLLDNLVRQILLSYDVSETMVRKFIVQFYAKTGVIEIKNGEIYGKQKD